MRIRSSYSRLHVKNPRACSRAGRILHRIASLNKKEPTEEFDTRKVLQRPADEYGNDHNALMALKNGGLIRGKKIKNKWYWCITKKGLKWDETYPPRMVVQKL